MGITLRTRKSLWAKSGNRCALCRLELVQDEDENQKTIIGQECHIVSSKPDGPRGDQPLFSKGYDHFDNLILLCANDHRRIDTSVDLYPVDVLLKLKKDHEDWVKSTLSIDPTSFTNDKLKTTSLPKIKSGKELVNLINGVHAFAFDYEDLKSNDEIETIPVLFDFLYEYVDMLDLMGFMEKAELAQTLDEKLVEIEKLGLYLFGLMRNVKLKNTDKKDMGRWNLTTIIAVRNDNPGIIDEFLITQTPEGYKFNT